MSAKQSFGLRHLAKGAGNSLVTFLSVIILYGSVLYILDQAFRYHWLLLLLPIGFYGFAVYLGILDLRSPLESVPLPATTALACSGSSACLVVNLYSYSTGLVNGIPKDSCVF